MAMTVDNQYGSSGAEALPHPGAIAEPEGTPRSKFHSACETMFTPAIEQKLYEVIKDSGYTLGQFIKGGAFGKVYTITHASGDVKALKLECMVARPLLRKQIRDLPMLGDRVSMLLQHNSLMRPHNIFYSENNELTECPETSKAATIASIMPLLSETNLGEQIKALKADKQKLSRSHILSIALNLAEGLASAHKARIVHGDVHSGNIAFRPDGSPVLLDWGMARQYTDATTPHEQTSYRDDVQYLGEIIYEMLTLEEYPDSLEAIQNDPIFYTLLDKMILAAPKDRWTMDMVTQYLRDVDRVDDTASSEDDFIDFEDEATDSEATLSSSSNSSSSNDLDFDNVDGTAAVENDFDDFDD